MFFFNCASTGYQHLKMNVWLSAQICVVSNLNSKRNFCVIALMKVQFHLVNSDPVKLDIG